MHDTAESKVELEKWKPVETKTFPNSKITKKIAADFSNGRHWVGEISEGK